MKKNIKTTIVLVIILSLALAILTGCDQLFDILDAFLDSDSGNLQVHMIDVGQGESILIVTPNQKTILIDGGEVAQGKKVKAYLTKHNINKIDLLVATHPHSDHIGGLPEIVDNFKIGEVIMPEKMHTSKIFEKLLISIESKGLSITPPPIGKVMKFDTDINLHFLGPVKEYGDNLNLWSVVFRLDYKNRSFLFTGDTEVSAENDLIDIYNADDFKAHVLNVAHHGSNTSTSEQFLNYVNPDIALISLGKDNSYGHPHKEVMDRLEKANTLIYRTDLQQSVVILSDGEDIWSNQEPL